MRGRFMLCVIQFIIFFFLFHYILFVNFFFIFIFLRIENQSTILTFEELL